MAEREFGPADWYRVVTPEDEVRQGDQLFGVTLRVVIPSDEAPGSWDIGEFNADVIVATQSCDLEQAKVSQVEVIPYQAQQAGLVFAAHSPAITVRLPGEPLAHRFNPSA